MHGRARSRSLQAPGGGYRGLPYCAAFPREVGRVLAELDDWVAGEQQIDGLRDVGLGQVGRALADWTAGWVAGGREAGSRDGG